MTVQTRSKTLAQAAQQSGNTPQTTVAGAEAESTISVQWLLLDDNNPLNEIHLIDIPHSLFKDKLRDRRDIFADGILREFSLKVIANSIILWKPKQPLLLKEVFYSDEWNPRMKDIKDRLDYIPSGWSLAEVPHSHDKERVDLVITIRPLNATKRDEEDNGVPTLPEFQRYKDIISTPGLAPSKGAKLEAYASCQARPSQAIYDGRHPSKARFVTIAPPIEIFHPVFQKFTRLVHDPQVQPTDNDLVSTKDLMQLLSIVEREEKEPSRNRAICDRLTEMLRADIHEQANVDRSSADGAYMLWVAGTRIPLVIIELKREFGEGGCDPSTQAGLSMRRAWIQEHRSGIREKCCCPTLMISGGGSWMGILGGVFTDKFIVQRLTDMMWLGYSSTEEDIRVYQFARVLNAFRSCIFELQDYYQKVGATQNVTLTRDLVHPRYYPYPTSFPGENNQPVNFKFLGPMQQGDSTCVAYKAETSNGDLIVVKFVTKYSTEVHKFLADKGHAPKLLYAGALPQTGILVESYAKASHPGLSIGPMQMIVMEHISVCTETPVDARQQLEAVLAELHVAGYVFGDLRLPNILFDRNGKLKLIDFDWAGLFDTSIHDNLDNLRPELQQKIKDSWEKINRKQPGGGYVCYPLNLSKDLWVNGVGDLKPIRPVHDWDMLDRLPL